MHLFPHRARARVGEVLTQIASVLRKWLVTQLIAMLMLAVVWAIALSDTRVKAALALAVIAGILEFVPTIGPTMAVVPALAMALLDSPGKALSVLIVYLVIQGFEANVLIPLLMNRRISLASGAHDRRAGAHDARVRVSRAHGRRATTRGRAWCPSSCSTSRTSWAIR